MPLATVITYTFQAIIIIISFQLWAIQVKNMSDLYLVGIQHVPWILIV